MLKYRGLTNFGIKVYILCLNEPSKNNSIKYIIKLWRE